MDKQKYFLGLDIGTDSVGFAATDMNYHVIRKGKKEIIGTRLFESGNTAEERRGYRSSRRRLQRKKERTQYLQLLFDEAICKIDTGFFQRLSESMYHLEDKSIAQYNSLFDQNYSDKDYYKDYPTIYHLRKALINGECTDSRLLYLGLAHILKNRGHFLFYGNEFGSVTDFNVAYSALSELFDTEEYERFKLEITDIYKLEEILKNNSLGITLAEKEVYKLLPNKPSIDQKNIIKLILGRTVALPKLFNDLDDGIIDKKISFKGNFEELYIEIAPKLDDKIILIDVAKSIYDWSILVDILDCPNTKQGETTLSDAQIYKFETHKKDLLTLKAMVKEYIPSVYADIFQNPTLPSNYPAYIGMSKSNGHKVVIEKKICSQEDFCKFVLAKFKGITLTNEHENAIIKKLENGTLLPKQRTKDNSVIPYQIHKQELDLILQNNKKNFAFLNDVSDGYTVAEKIQMVFMYRIPYYVGPLNEHSKHAWIVKNIPEKIHPWNFETVVNLEESAEAFIRRMTSKCTYLRDKDVIPQKSLLYSKFTLLNELNNVKLNGEPISISLKQELFENLFKSRKKVTIGALKGYLRQHSHAGKDLIVTGIDGDFKGSLESYIDFRQIFGEPFDIEMVEDIIRWIVLFSEDKKMLKRKILSKYDIPENELKQICNLKYSGWGKLSKEFLTEIYEVDQSTGEMISIIDAMYDTNNNLMQLLSKEHTYIKLLSDLKQEKDNITLEDVQELYCSPAVKKSIWQAVSIVKEIEKIMGGTPEKLFIEMTRADGKNEATTSRHKDLLKKYNTIKKEYASIYSELESKSDSDLRQKKLYLYFTQLGKCAYTGRSIDLGSLLASNDIYDIEHIYPRSKTKDDSIHNNLVLVYKTANAKKTDHYPIPDEYRQEALWNYWYGKDLITKTKYDRLMRKTPFEPKELEGFIARQLVETGQSTKAVAELFGSYYSNKNSEVVYVKAGNVSDFRHHFDLVKVREINDFHHAHDAYLNIVVGNVWHTKFTKNFFMNIQNEKFNLKPEKLYGYDVKKGDYYAWKSTDNGSIQLVKNVLGSKKILFTRHSFKATGTFFDQTIYKKGEGEFAVKNPLSNANKTHKLTDLTKYGSYKSIKGAYFCVVEHVQKKKLVRTIEYVPIYLAEQIKQDESLLMVYLEEKLQLQNPKIILRELKYGSLLNVDGFPMHLSGRTGSQLVFRGAVQLHMDAAAEKYFKKVSKLCERMKSNPNTKISPYDIITQEQNLVYYDFFANKLNTSIYNIRFSSQVKKLTEKRNEFIQLDTEQQCKILINILVIFHCNAAMADLTLINGGASSGGIFISKKISERSSVKLIHQSITGVYENSIDLLK